MKQLVIRDDPQGSVRTPMLAPPPDWESAQRVVCEAAPLAPGVPPHAAARGAQRQRRTRAAIAELRPEAAGRWSTLRCGARLVAQGAQRAGGRASAGVPVPLLRTPAVGTDCATELAHYTAASTPQRWMRTRPAAAGATWCALRSSATTTLDAAARYEQSVATARALASRAVLSPVVAAAAGPGNRELSSPPHILRSTLALVASPSRGIASAIALVPRAPHIAAAAAPSGHRPRAARFTRDALDGVLDGLLDGDRAALVRLRARAPESAGTTAPGAMAHRFGARPLPVARGRVPSRTT